MQDRSWTAEAKQEQQKRKSNLGGEPTSSARQFRRVDLRAICVMHPLNQRFRKSSTEQVDGRTKNRQSVMVGVGKRRTRGSTQNRTTLVHVPSWLRTSNERRTTALPTYDARRVLSVRRSAAAVARRWCLKTLPSSVVLALPGVFASDEIEDGRRRPGTTGPRRAALWSPALAFSTDTCH